MTSISNGSQDHQSDDATPSPAATDAVFPVNYTPSSTNLFVRYLPRDVDDEQLRTMFAVYGTITSYMVMRDIHSGNSLGTAFVRYDTHEEAQKALTEADGLVVQGRTLNVQWAKQQHDITPAGEERNKMNKLFLRNVPLDVTDTRLGEMLSQYGTVVKVSLHNDTTPFPEPSLCRRIAFVTFAEEGAAEAALRIVHNTCPFPSCNDVPLMAKLINDAIKSKKQLRLKQQQQQQQQQQHGPVNGGAGHGKGAHNTGSYLVPPPHSSSHASLVSPVSPSPSNASAAAATAAAGSMGTGSGGVNLFPVPPIIPNNGVVAHGNAMGHFQPAVSPVSPSPVAATDGRRGQTYTPSQPQQVQLSAQNPPPLTIGAQAVHVGTGDGCSPTARTSTSLPQVRPSTRSPSTYSNTASPYAQQSPQRQLQSQFSDYAVSGSEAPYGYTPSASHGTSPYYPHAPLSPSSQQTVSLANQPPHPHLQQSPMPFPTRQHSTWQSSAMMDDGLSEGSTGLDTNMLQPYDNQSYGYNYYTGMPTYVQPTSPVPPVTTLSQTPPRGTMSISHGSNSNTASQPALNGIYIPTCQTPPGTVSISPALKPTPSPSSSSTAVGAAGGNAPSAAAKHMTSSSTVTLPGLSEANSTVHNVMTCTPRASVGLTPHTLSGTSAVAFGATSSPSELPRHQSMTASSQWPTTPIASQKQPQQNQVSGEESPSAESHPPHGPSTSVNKNGAATALRFAPFEPSSASTPSAGSPSFAANGMLTNSGSPNGSMPQSPTSGKRFCHNPYNITSNVKVVE